jgi:hypothetical protein
MNRRWQAVGFVASLGCVSGMVMLLGGCPGARDLPPRPADEPRADEKKEEVPFCGKVFSDARTHKKGACCVGAAAGILKSADVVSACGVAPAAYLGEARDGSACRLYFQPAGGDAQESWIMVSHPVIPVGAPAPVRPDPMLPWRWKKVPLRVAIGYQAIAAQNEPGLLERQTIFWAGRGRRILGLHVSKQVCNEAQALTLAQRAIDAVP